MARFLKKCVLFLTAFFFFDKLFYLFLVISPQLQKDTRLEKVVRGELKSDMVVLGSSRGARNIIAGQIEDSLNLTCFNLSYPGSDIEFHEFLLRVLINCNEKPEIILLAVDDPIELLPDETINFRFDVLYPLARYRQVNDEMIARGKKTLISKVMVLSRMNKRNFDIRKQKFSPLDTIADCGSMPISFQRDNREFIYDGAVREYLIENESGQKVSSFRKLQNLCLKNDIKLVIVFSPNFHLHNKGFENRIRELSIPEVQFYIYDTINPVYTDSDFFYDEGHLQKKGAVIFTNEIINYLESSSVARGKGAGLLMEKVQ